MKQEPPTHGNPPPTQVVGGCQRPTYAEWVSTSRIPTEQDSIWLYRGGPLDREGLLVADDFGDTGLFTSYNNNAVISPDGQYMYLYASKYTFPLGGLDNYFRWWLLKVDPNTDGRFKFVTELKDFNLSSLFNLHILSTGDKALAYDYTGAALLELDSSGGYRTLDYLYSGDQYVRLFGGDILVNEEDEELYTASWRGRDFKVFSYRDNSLELSSETFSFSHPGDGDGEPRNQDFASSSFSQKYKTVYFLLSQNGYQGDDVELLQLAQRNSQGQLEVEAPIELYSQTTNGQSDKYLNAMHVSQDSQYLYIVSTMTQQLRVFTLDAKGVPALQQELPLPTNISSPELDIVENNLYLSDKEQDLLLHYTIDTQSHAIAHQRTYEAGSQGIEGLREMESLVVSRDAKHLYLVGDNNRPLTVLKMTDQGLVQQGKEMFAGEEQWNATDGLHEATAVRLSPDGSQVFVSAKGDHSLAIFDIQNDGVPKKRRVFKDDIAGIDGLEKASNLSVSPDGRYIVVTSPTDQAISVFTRDQDGNVSFQDYYQDAEALSSPQAVVISPDSQSIVVLNSDDTVLAIYQRDAQGELELQQTLDVAALGIEPGHRALAISPDGQYIAVTSAVTGTLSILHYLADNGQWTVSQNFVQAADVAEGLLENPSAVAFSSDSQDLYVKTEVDNAPSILIFALGKSDAGWQYQKAFIHEDENFNGPRYEFTLAAIKAIDTQFYTLSGVSAYASTVLSRDGYWKYTVGGDHLAFDEKMDVIHPQPDFTLSSPQTGPVREGHEVIVDFHSKNGKSFPDFDVNDFSSRGAIRLLDSNAEGTHFRFAVRAKPIYVSNPKYYSYPNKPGIKTGVSYAPLLNWDIISSMNTHADYAENVIFGEKIQIQIKFDNVVETHTVETLPLNVWDAKIVAVTMNENNKGYTVELEASASGDSDSVVTFSLDDGVISSRSDAEVKNLAIPAQQIYVHAKPQ